MIFLYTKDASLGEEERKLVIAAGYIPVEVASFDAVKILPPPLPKAQLDMISNAALIVISKSSDNIRALFASYLCGALLGDKK